MNNTSNYTRQVIVAFLSGANDQIIIDEADNLMRLFVQQTQQGSPRFLVRGGPDAPAISLGANVVDTATLRHALATQFAGHPMDSRLYICGHGDWHAKKIGAWPASQVANLLGAAWKCWKISVTGCDLAKGSLQAGVAPPQDPNELRKMRSLSSFASELASALAKNCAEVTARYESVTTYDNGARATIVDVQKGKWQGRDEQSKRPNSKLVFSTSGGKLISDIVGY